MDRSASCVDGSSRCGRRARSPRRWSSSPPPRSPAPRPASSPTAPIARACDGSSCEAAKGDPARRAKLLGTPEHVDAARRARSSPATADSRAPTTPRRCAPASDSCESCEGEGHGRAPLQRRQEGRRLLPLPGHRGRRQLRRHVRPTDLRRRPPRRRERRRALRRRRGPPGPAGLDAIPVRREPESSRSNSCCRSPCPAMPIDEAPERLKGYTEFEPEVEQLLDHARAQAPSRARSSPRS